MRDGNTPPPHTHTHNFPSFRYPETVLWLEWLVWSLVFGIPSLLAFCCSCVRPFRECIIVLFKRICGVGHFALLAPLDPRSRMVVIKETIEIAQRRHGVPKRTQSSNNLKKKSKVGLMRSG